MVLNKRYVVFLLGYAHIDSEWLWSINETVNLCKSTFAKVLNLMEQHPILTFAQGGILCCELLEEEYPSIIQRVREAVKRNQFEFSASFLEFDAYMLSGESILRHLLYGAKYLDKLGIGSDVLFLPDSFGFPNTLPKLLKGFGIKYFVTYKLNWNDTNEFPYHVFRWGEGVDEVIAYLTPGSYNDNLSSVKRILWNMLIQMRKQNIPAILQFYGRGDHGGGPDEVELVNIGTWIRKYYPVIAFIPSTMSEFFKFVEKTYGDALPLFSGELYLEFHRGVYTTGALAKKLNRINENLVIDVEKIYSLLKTIFKEKYPKNELSRIWKMMLLNQGHDALPATVPEEVYETIIQRGYEAFRSLLNLLRQGLGTIAAKERGKYVIFNPNSWHVSIYKVVKGECVNGYCQRLENGDNLIYLKNLPPLGFKIFNTLGEKPSDSVSVTENGKYYILENMFLKVIVDKDTGWVVDIHDKRYNHKVLSGPIRLRILWDYPLTLRGKTAFAAMFDAWEAFYLDGLNKFFYKDLKAYSHRISAKGPMYASITFEFKHRHLLFGSSHFSLSIGVYAEKPFVEIRFRGVWKALHKFLKLMIPIGVSVNEAVFEMPYGVIRRRDSCRSENPMDRAKYEVPGQRWVDISDGCYGVAIVNDSKYGFSWCNGVLGVSLLRSPLQPIKRFIIKSMEMHPEIEKRFKDISFQIMSKSKQYAIQLGLLLITSILKLVNMIRLRPIDHGYHTATIWIYPHQGDYVEGGVANLASELNTRYVLVRGNVEGVEKSFSLLSVEPSDKVHVTAVKLCEYDDNCLVLRLFNASHMKIVAKLKFNVDVTKVYRATHQEKPVCELPISHENMVSVFMEPFAVETILAKLEM